MRNTGFKALHTHKHDGLEGKKAEYVDRNKLQWEKDTKKE